MSDKVKVDLELVYVRDGDMIPDGLYIEVEDARPKAGHRCAESRWIIKIPDTFKVPEPPPKLREVQFATAASHMANGGEARPKTYGGDRWFRLIRDAFLDDRGEAAVYWILNVNEPWIIKERA